MNVLTGLILSSFVAGLATFKKSLSISGFVSAITLGTILYAIDSRLFLVMMAFFVSSSFLSKFVQRQRKFEPVILKKGSQRDLSQVVANGIIPLLFALLYAIDYKSIYLLGFISGFAAANADTWASEIGSMSQKVPRFIFKRSETIMGISGGVTTLGFVASGGGSLLIALFAVVLFPELPQVYGVIIFACGFLGALLDSVIGELWQAKYKDAKFGSLTEVRWIEHIENQLVSGYHWIDNNMVNFISILGAAVGSALIWLLM